MAGLQTTFTDISHQMNISKHDLQSTNNLLTSEQQLAAKLLAKLSTKEELLNQTKEELANVLGLAKTELDKLRDQLLTSSKTLAKCQGTVDIPQVGVSGDYDISYCGFEDSNDLNCGFTITNAGSSSYVHWARTSSKVHSSTGPSHDHTYGTPHGHYMMADAYYQSQHSSSSSVYDTFLTSKTFKPATNYCLRFWYNMYGRDIRPINVFVKINGGRGNPVLTLNGPSSTSWKLAQVEIDHEYTQHSFQFVIEASSDAHYSYSYHSYGSTKNYVKQYGNVAIDDVFVANTTCKDIPVCPPNAYKRQNADNTTSCYTFHTSGATWFHAADTCKTDSHEGHLVVIDSDDEQQFLVNTIQSDITLMTAGQNGFYTNGNDQGSEGTYQWTDSGVATTIKYFNWHQGQPNDVGSSQDCILMQYPDDGYKWGDVNCDEKHPFICEMTY
ncbi:hypothetical protein FSP39_005990 [Pinctada imbricata]|uniref:Uncharacterized protein n=1 Tax=Pinctada imbricata TaxID=66713 RepID=A0AA88Y7J1_PINIB|nr:hypothetical protein FSP39_005990 [Pinctada imbricata]